MKSSKLREENYDLINCADDCLLKMIYAFSKKYYTETTDWLVREDEIAYRRINEMKSGKVKGLSLEEVVSKARAFLVEQKKKS